MAIWGGIEAGGTKFVCAVGEGPGALHAETRFATTSPQQCLARAIDFFREQAAQHGPLAGLGLASFGPIDPDPKSPSYGYITTTPKPGWAQTDLLGPIRAALDLPVAFDTDVNAAALAEGKWGAARGLHTFIYLTVGTGIGGGAIVNGARSHGLMHPEMGHLYVPHDRIRDPFAGTCPYHGDCLEGLAAGPAIEKRWGKPGVELAQDHPGWALEAEYLGHGLAQLVYVLSPQRIVMGGGVMAQQQLFPLVRAALSRALRGYIQKTELGDDIDEFVVAPGLGAQAGVLGALALAQELAAP